MIKLATSDQDRQLVGLVRTKLSTKSIGETEWRGESIGCLASIVSTGSLEEGAGKVTTTKLVVKSVTFLLFCLLIDQEVWVDSVLRIP
jgi:hypothetical protein